MIHVQLDIKLGLFTEEELYAVLRASTKVWKTRKFDDILLQSCNAAYKQNSRDTWTKSFIFLFPKKGKLVITKKNGGVTLTIIFAKAYNVPILNRIRPKIKKINKKNQYGFRRNRLTTSQILKTPQIPEGVRAKNFEATLLFVDFSKSFDSIQRGKMEQIVFPFQKCGCYNDALQKHERNCSLT